MSYGDAYKAMNEETKGKVEKIHNLFQIYSALTGTKVAGSLVIAHQIEAFTEKMEDVVFHHAQVINTVGQNINDT